MGESIWMLLALRQRWKFCCGRHVRWRSSCGCGICEAMHGWEAQLHLQSFEFKFQTRWLTWGRRLDYNVEALFHEDGNVTCDRWHIDAGRGGVKGP